MRRRVVEIRDKLAQGLEALAGVANGNPVFTGDHLQELAGLVTPLMASPLVGEGACFEAARALASSLPDPLDRQSLAVACALHVVAQGPGSNPRRHCFLSPYFLAPHDVVLLVIGSFSLVSFCL